MGLMDTLRSIVGIPQEEQEDDIEETVDSEQEETEDVFDYYQDQPTRRSGKVVNIHATTQLQVVIVKPEKFEDASAIADHLNEKHTVVLNLESCPKDISRRLIDFLSGVAYANRGQIKKVANCTYIITPYHVDIMGDLIDELENSGVFF